MSKTNIFGAGLDWPYVVTPAGRLARSSGSDRMLDSAEQVLDTPKGCCPMDPQYGLDLDVYDTVGNAGELAWDVADAIEYAEPRAGEIDVEVVDADPGRGLVEFDVTLTPIGSQVPTNRVFPLYVRANE